MLGKTDAIPGVPIGELVVKDEPASGKEEAGESPGAPQTTDTVNAVEGFKGAFDQPLVSSTLNDLAESERRYRRLFEAARDGILLLDVGTGHITDANPFMTELLGYSREELLGKELWQIGLFEDRETNATAFRHLQETGYARYEDRPLQAVDGKRREVEFVSNVYRENGHFVIQCNIRDISERKEAQAQIEDLNIRLQRAVSESHHRIKNNLQVLLTLVELQTPLQEETDSASGFKRIGQHIRTLASIHDLMTDSSRLGRNLETISLKAALEKLVPLLQATSGGRTIRVQAQEMTLSLKQGGSFSLLVNELVSNALKHGKGAVNVMLTVSQPLTARLEVWDEDGPGFPDGFDPHTAAHSGLELIDSMGRWDLGGEILFQNRPNGGGSVVITFPLQE